jgi:anti-sigma B factor antagonist
MAVGEDRTAQRDPGKVGAAEPAGGELDLGGAGAGTAQGEVETVMGGLVDEFDGLTGRLQQGRESGLGNPAHVGQRTQPVHGNICYEANMDLAHRSEEDEPVALTVSTRNDPACSIVAVSGDVDISTSPDLREALAGVLAAGARAIVVDMSGVRFIDSTGLGVLVGTYTSVRNAGGRLALVNDHAAVLKVLSITALDEVLNVHPTLADAVASVSEPAPATEI